MRWPLSLGLLALAASLPACGGSAPASQRSTALKARSAYTPSGFVIQTAIADPECNGGRGIRVPAALAGNAVLASGSLGDGSTLVALSSIYPGKRFAILHSFTTRCAPNQEFGDHGVATIGIHSHLRPAHSTSPGMPADGLWVNVVAARSGGGAIVAGTYGGRWVVGEVTPRGQMDESFGNRGWTALAFNGEVREVLQEPSGRIILAGDTNPSGCCTRNWAAAISAHGEPEDGFGAHGRVELPTAGEAGVEALALEPNGDILAQIGYGNNGCWGVVLAMLTPSGDLVPGFKQRLDQFWKRLGFGAFVGDVHPDGNGFTLVGTGERACDGYARQVATGLIARIQVDGRTAGTTTRFRSRMYGEVHAFSVGDDNFIVELPYGDSTRLTLAVRRSDGSTDARFANRGHAWIHTRWSGFHAVLGTTASVTRAGQREIVVVATRDGRNELHLMRVRI
jgi:hypothetical protein